MAATLEFFDATAEIVIGYDVIVRQPHEVVSSRLPQARLKVVHRPSIEWLAHVLDMSMLVDQRATDILGFIRRSVVNNQNLDGRIVLSKRRHDGTRQQLRTIEGWDSDCGQSVYGLNQNTSSCR
jgi:hypothetical protein